MLALSIHRHVSVMPSDTVKFLGILVDKHLTFIDHVNFVTKKCNSKLFLMRQLKRLGMNKHGLKVFYCAHIRSVLSYASPVFYTQLSDSVKAKLERVQKTATEIICPHFDYVTRLSILDLCTLDSFIHTQMEKHFSILHAPFQ